MTSRRAALASMIALPLAALARPAGAQSLSADNGVAAKVNGEAISTYDLVQRMRLLVMLSALRPDDQTVGWLQRYALTSLINDRLKDQEFERFKPLSELDGDIDDQIKALSQGDAARIGALLGAAQVDGESLRAYLRAQIAWTNLVRGRLGSRVQISPDLADQEAARLSAPDSAKVRLTGLFVADQSCGERATGLAMARQLAVQARAGVDLAGLSATFSDPSIYSTPGAGRWLPVESLDADVAAKAADAAIGALSDPIEIRDGVLLLAVLDRYQPGGSASPPEITAETAGQQLANDRLTALAGRYLRDLKTSAEISA